MAHGFTILLHLGLVLDAQGIYWGLAATRSGQPEMVPEDVPVKLECRCIESTSIGGGFAAPKIRNIEHGGLVTISGRSPRLLLCILIWCCCVSAAVYLPLCICHCVSATVYPPLCLLCCICTTVSAAVHLPLCIRCCESGALYPLLCISCCVS